MKFRIRRQYLSLFLLSVFLFSYSVKGIHDIIHADDEHCHVLNAKHFHSEQHHCAICDFEIPWYDKSANPPTVSSLHHFIESYRLLPFNIHVATGISVRSSRAPPVLV